MEQTTTPPIGSSDGLAIVEKTRLAICHLAKSALELHSQTATIYGKNPGIAEVAFPRDVALLNALLTHLLEAEAFIDEDAWCLGVFEEAHKMANVRISDGEPKTL